MATMFHQHENTIELKMHAPERELVVRPMEGKKTLDSNGLVDPRVWKGGNSLRAIMGENGLWYCKYENGLLPEPLKQQFTSVSRLIAFAREYFAKRNLEIVEIKDVHHGS